MKKGEGGVKGGVFTSRPRKRAQVSRGRVGIVRAFHVRFSVVPVIFFVTRVFVCLGWERTPAKIVMSHMNAASPRQSLVKGERLTRYELAAVMPGGSGRR